MERSIQKSVFFRDFLVTDLSKGYNEKKRKSVQFYQGTDEKEAYL